MRTQKIAGLVHLTHVSSETATQLLIETNGEFLPAFLRTRYLPEQAFQHSYRISDVAFERFLLETKPLADAVHQALPDTNRARCLADLQAANVAAEYAFAVRVATRYMLKHGLDTPD